MSVLRLGAIVEGHGEVKALPVLIHRIAAEWDPSQTVVVDPVIRSPASWLKSPAALESEVENVSGKVGRKGGILILLDCDWDGGCPKLDGPSWLARAKAARSDMPLGVVLAFKEYEAWFIAAAESIRGQCRISIDTAPPADPESIRGAKGWLTRHMPRNRPYSETDDQPDLSRVFDMQLARKRSNSFDKCYREIVGLLNAVKAKEQA
jgi:hypothetical protein